MILIDLDGQEKVWDHLHPQQNAFTTTVIVIMLDLRLTHQPYPKMIKLYQGIGLRRVSIETKHATIKSYIYDI